MGVEAGWMLGQMLVLIRESICYAMDKGRIRYVSISERVNY